MKARMRQAAYAVKRLVVGREAFNMNMCSNCGKNPPYIGTMCRSCAGIS